MPFQDLYAIAKDIIDTVEPDSMSDETLSKLGAILTEKLVIAALDLIDRGNVIHYETPWGYSEYEVLGSTTTYTVLVDLKTAQVPYSCTCPAFTFNVLMSGTHIMCKHVLATLIGRAMRLSTRRPAKADDLAFLYCQRHPLSSSEHEDMQT